jgi:hypothetical protein
MQTTCPNGTISTKKRRDMQGQPGDKGGVGMFGTMSGEGVKYRVTVVGSDSFVTTHRQTSSILSGVSWESVLCELLQNG